MGTITNGGQMLHFSLLAAALLLNVIVCDVLRGEREGYFAFEEAPSRFMRPPQVRKPPYMMSTIPCQTGEGYHNKKPSPKYTLCGDLNKGFIPLNPLGQEFGGQPYPFELIKNKTLAFLSKALPYLKQDPKIPKVSKISSKKPIYSHNKPSTNDYRRPTNTPYRNKRSAEEAKNETVHEEYLNDIIDNSTTGRQNCDQGGAAGMLCSLQSVMSNNKIPIALMTAVAQSLASSLQPSTQAPQEYTTERPSMSSYPQQESSGDILGGGGGSMAEAVLGLLGTLANMASSGGPGTVKDSSLNNEEEPSTLAHVMSVLTGASPGSSNALSLVLKLMSSEASPLKALAGAFPGNRRRRPVAADDMMASESNVRRPHDNAELDLPPTPCPSSEEYVTPTFARNYQGVWKYVVQIPQEGYFTQTVQQTKCMKGRCDFMDGICHESPRWVSLLVAETYYPDSFLPTTSSTVLPPPPPPVEDFYNFQQYLKRRVGETDGEDEESSYRARPVYKDRKQNSMQHCDGVDHIGCYVVRLYYDWFLVNGSCKCWKPSPKRVLTGR